MAAAMFAAVKASLAGSTTYWSTPGGPGAAMAERGLPLMMIWSPGVTICEASSTWTQAVALTDGATRARQTSRNTKSVRFTVAFVPS